jgi:hypothetical protein
MKKCFRQLSIGQTHDTSFRTPEYAAKLYFVE